MNYAGFEFLMGPVIAGLIGSVVWMALRRKVELKDREFVALKDEVGDLRDDRVMKLEQAQDRARESRGEIRQKAASMEQDIRVHFVHKKECAEFREMFVRQQEEFHTTILKLERVGEKTDMMLGTIKMINEQQVALGQDLARLQGKGDK